MKKFLKYLMPLFGASFSFIDPPVHSLTKKLSNLKELFINTKVEKQINFETGLENNQSHFLDKEKTDLNQTKVFLIVKTQKNNKKKGEKNTLLLVGAEDQMNASSKLKKLRHHRFVANFDHSWTKEGRKIRGLVRSEPLKGMIPPTLALELQIYRIRFPEATATGLLSNLSIAKNFRGTSYLKGPNGGYKSLCPVFFEESSAKDFLIENLQSTMDEKEKTLGVKQIRLKAPQKKIKKTKSLSQNIENLKSQDIENLKNVKIICLGLGDFIQYYSTAPNEKALEKVDFLFFPDFEAMSKTKNKKIGLKGFKAYQEEFYAFKSIEKNKN